jgi:hypothetical protein
MTEERRAVTDVRDIPAENGVKINNVLTFLVLAVMSWVGYNINTMKTDIAEMRGFQQTTNSRLSRAEKDVEGITVKVNGINKRVYKLEGAQ